MTAPGRRVVVVGGGIVGLAVAERVVRDEPSSEVTVLEKEHDWALHQTGRNSGVVHSGLYYPPGSLKARWCAAGARALLDPGPGGRGAPCADRQARRGHLHH